MPLTDNRVHSPFEYESFAPPIVGSSYADPAFGSMIRRISNALGTHDAGGLGGNLAWITGEYSTPCPFNSDNSLLVLLHASYFALYGSSGLYLRDLPLEITASSEPRWSRKDNHTLYYVHGNQLKSFDVTSGVTSVVHTFNVYSAISGCGESDISLDGDHFVFAGDKKFIFVYELSTDKTFPALDTYVKDFDSLYLTPSNGVLVSWLEAGAEQGTDGPYCKGIELFDKAMVFQRQVFPCNGHKDTMLDVDGSEIMVVTDANDSESNDNAIVKVRLSDGKRTTLLSLDWSLAVHVSTPDKGGFCYVETYAPSNPQAVNFKPYCNELLKVPLDGSPVQRLAHHRSRPNVENTYNWQPKISCSRDGSRCIFASNYNARAREGVNDQYADVYMIEVANPHPTPGPMPPRPHPPSPPFPPGPHPRRRSKS